MSPEPPVARWWIENRWNLIFLMNYILSKVQGQNEKAAESVVGRWETSHAPIPGHYRGRRVKTLHQLIAWQTSDDAKQIFWPQHKTGCDVHTMTYSRGIHSYTFIIVYIKGGYLEPLQDNFTASKTEGISLSHAQLNILFFFFVGVTG